MSTAAPQRPELNLVSPENLRDPAPLYRRLQEEEPVYWAETMGAWFVTRYADVMACLRDPYLSADRAVFFEHQVRALGPDIARDFIATVRLQMLMKDGADHLRLRRQASPGFYTQVLDTWRPSIRSIMNMLVERVSSQGRMDVAKDISYHMPPMVIAEFLGIPPEDRERFQQWAYPQAAFTSPDPNADMATLASAANKAIVELSSYLSKVFEERRQNPGQDAFSLMIQAQSEGRTTPEEMVANAILILSAGHMTTTDQLSNAVHDLLDHPEQLQLLRSDPGLLRSAVEEVIRFHPAVPFTFRIATRDIQLRGRTIPQGSMVFLGLAAASRDPEVFPEPDRFDITRDHVHQKHMAFGFGAHHCLGAGLTRRELEIAIEVLLHHLPGLRLDEERPAKVKCHSLLFRGYDSLPVRWE